MITFVCLNSNCGANIRKGLQVDVVRQGFNQRLVQVIQEYVHYGSFINFLSFTQFNFVVDR